MCKGKGCGVERSENADDGQKQAGGCCRAAKQAFGEMPAGGEKPAAPAVEQPEKNRHRGCHHKPS